VFDVFEPFCFWPFVAFSLNAWWANFLFIVLLFYLVFIDRSPHKVCAGVALLHLVLHRVHPQPTPLYSVSAKLPFTLVDGLILAHPPVFYASLLFFFFLWPRQGSTPRPHTFGCVWFNNLRLFVYVAGGFALISGGY